MKAKIFVPSDGGLASQLFWLGRGLEMSKSRHESLLFGHATSRGSRPFTLDRLIPSVSHITRPGRLPASITRKVAEFAGYHYLDEANPEHLGINLALQVLRGPDTSEVAREIFSPVVRLNQIALHFRAGDYRNNAHTSSIHGMMHKDWFIEGVEAILNQVGSNHVERLKVFSDEPEFAETVLGRELEEMGFPTVFSSESRIERVMAECSSSTHFLGANSGISFWISAAREELEPGRYLTILPETWFRSVNDEVRNWFIEGTFAPLRSLRRARFISSRFSDT